MTLHNPPRPCRIVDGLGQLVPDYDVVLCDVWGVVHDGRRAFPDAADALTHFRRAGGTVVLLTNAPRPEGPVVAQLDDLGLPRAAYDAVVTSGDATAALLEERGMVPAYHIGPPRDLALLDEVRRKTGHAPPLTELDKAGYVLCTGLFEDATETPDDYAATLAAMLARGLEMICANPDIVVHVGHKLIYCGGAIAERYEIMGGRVLYAGKPHRPIYDVALSKAASLRGAAKLRGAPIDRSRVLAVGDGLHTDVAGAAAQALDCLFVTSGIHRAETLSPGTRRIDPEGLRDLLAGAGQSPVAAIAHLVW